MKKITTFLAALFITFGSQSQDLFVPGGSTGTSSNSNIGIGTSSPTEYFHINPAGISPYLKIERTGTSQNPYGGYGIKIGTSGSLYTSVYPSCGSGTFTIKGDETYGSTISFRGSAINFGTGPNTCGGGQNGGKFNFGGGITWITDLVVSGYPDQSPGQYSAPSGYKLAVNGSANFNSNVVIGGVPGFTQGFPSGYLLFVAGGILTEKVKVAVRTTTDWSDYVFAKDYNLMPLTEVENFVNKNAHLPNVPSAQEVVNNGINVAEMDAKLLEKIEELTLYIIQQQKEIEELKKQFKNQK